MAYYESPALTVTWDGELGAVTLNWHDFAHSDQYREGLNQGLELVREKNARNWLADLRDLGTVRQDDQQWTHEEWHPRAFETSLSNMAIIQPESVITNLSVDDLVQEVGSNVTSRMFDNRPDAEAWLREQRQSHQRTQLGDSNQEREHEQSSSETLRDNYRE
ncbi:STAS/SEC14 domain-containing protein [Natrinema sp. 74]|uniref:STAS/SEC14 domain-containing protein n=1 Tax=Natrinema sp. 74 TaxID=3384159 RepID=UPI0038D39C9C